MNKKRYIELERNPHLRLTEDEVKEGWHFCDDWDGLLIHELMPEFSSCLCNLEINNKEPE